MKYKEIKLPPFPEHQINYIRKIIKDQEDAFDPNMIIGGIKEGKIYKADISDTGQTDHTNADHIVKLYHNPHRNIIRNVDDGWPKQYRGLILKDKTIIIWIAFDANHYDIDRWLELNTDMRANNIEFVVTLGSVGLRNLNDDNDLTVSSRTHGIDNVNYFKLNSHFQRMITGYKVTYAI